MHSRTAISQTRILAVLLALFSSSVLADSDEDKKQLKLDGVPFNERKVPVYKQDDHLHTTPDKAFRIFKSMDRDSDRRVRWSEVERSGYDIDRQIFKRLDTDGSEDLDREEFTAMGPSHESNYREPGHSEP